MSKIPDVFTGPCLKAMLGTMLPINASCLPVVQALLPVRLCNAAIPSDLGFRTNSHQVIAGGQAEACPTENRP
jgi:hypothetical protein